MKKYGVPDKAGLYFGKSIEGTWWNLVVEATGQPPFMKLRAYKRIFGNVGEVDPDYVKVWGPRIEEPE